MKNNKNKILIPLFLTIFLAGCDNQVSSVVPTTSTSDSTADISVSNISDLSPVSSASEESSLESSSTFVYLDAIAKTIAEIREIESDLSKNQKSQQRYLVTAYVTKVTGPTAFLLGDDLETTTNIIPILDTNSNLPSLHRKDKATFDVAIRKNSQGVLQLIDCIEVKDVETSTYHITATGEHGSITTDKESYTYGETATITISHEEGYKLSHFLYNENRVDVFQIKDNQYTFTMEDDITISLTFVTSETPLSYQAVYAFKNYYSGKSYALSDKTISENGTSISFEGSACWYANTEGIRCYPGDKVTFSLNYENCYFASMEMVYSSETNCPCLPEAFSTGTYTSEFCDGTTFATTNVLQHWYPNEGEQVNSVTLTVMGEKTSGDGSRRHNLKNVIINYLM